MSPPVISIVCLTRNAPRLARSCLYSLLDCVGVGSGAMKFEFVVVDDCSDERTDTLPLLREFKADVSASGGRDVSATTIVRFRRPMGYSAGLAYAFSLARGDAVLFVSHDMVVPPDCLAELLAVAEHDASIGVVRPCSEHMDWARALVQLPPTPVASPHDVAVFAARVRSRFAGDVMSWPMLIGDAMLVKRSVIDRIGVFDTRFDGYLADIDYGIRVHRARFRHAIARGAWLHHEGGGMAKESAASGGASVSEQAARMLAQVQAAYDVLRQKWGEANLPPHFRDMKRQHFEALHALPPMDADAVVPPMKWSDEVGEFIE